MFYRKRAGAKKLQGGSKTNPRNLQEVPPTDRFEMEETDKRQNLTRYNIYEIYIYMYHVFAHIYVTYPEAHHLKYSMHYSS